MSIPQKTVAVVTGAGRGVGLAIAHRLAQSGHHVVLCARSQSELDHAAVAITSQGGSASVSRCDISDPAQVAALSASVLAEFSRCDVLVNNAGIGSVGTPLHQVDPAKFQAVLSTNLVGPYLMLRAFAPAMIAACTGHIINIGSLAGKNPLPNGAPYAASKWGLLGLMQSAAEELRPHGVRVSVISPGSIATGFANHPGADDDWKISPDDVAAVVAEIVAQSPRSFISEVLLRPLRKPKA
jgi:NAD(P)-dependent dehydrogenase (short-subunit alcohol dehydrogenase family)